MTVPLLSVKNLSVSFKTRSGTVKVLDDVSFSLGKGEVLGIVGESGSGKSVLSYALMGLLDENAEIKADAIEFGGIDLAGPNSPLASIRGRELSMIFQSPRTALNPIMKAGRQIEDVLRRHGPVTRSNARAAAIAALEKVRIPDPERRYNAYPFELSGGMCQRVMIAMALSCSPSPLIADEPTTGLDVTTQAVVMDLMRDLVRETRMSSILITHDLALAGEYCDRIVVMHAGHMVEMAPANELRAHFAHPYTKGLFAATPTAHTELEDLSSIPGSLPDLTRDLPSCRFLHRCDRRQPDCETGHVALAPLGNDHSVRCRHPL